MSANLNHILIVDDDQDIRLIARLALRRGGWQVDVAGSGPEALDKVASARPDLVILDVMLEDERGTELLERLPPGLPVVFLTARTDVSADGVAGVIHKPFDPAKLASQIESIWQDAGPDRAAATG